MDRSRFRALTLLITFTALSLPPMVFARGGGGHTSSGGGHSSSSSHGGGGGYGGGGVGYVGGGGYGYSNSGGGGFGVFFIIFIVLIVAVFLMTRRKSNSGSSDAAADLLHQSRNHGDASDAFLQNRGQSGIELIQTHDPAFSLPAFFDFAYALFGKLQKSRAGNKLDTLSGYFSDSARDAYRKESQNLKEVDGVLVSGVQLKAVEALETTLQITLTYQSNYTEIDVISKSQSWYSEETWVFQKKKGVLSKPPEKMQQITCPACGAVPSFNDQGICGACGQQITHGNFDWFVESISISRNQMPPLLTETVEEEGTDLPTVYAPGFMETQKTFLEKHPDFNWNGFYERVKTVYFALQTAWTEEKWEIVRPYESENLFQMHLYWIEEYKKQGMRNVLEDVKLHRIEPVKINEDQYYESITARVFGSMIDFTVKENPHARVAGNPGATREFTEYWTFIRTHEGIKKEKHETGCPACGAPLKINQSGRCEYCQALVTSGDFDWVLSQIEQDETYQG